MHRHRLDAYVSDISCECCFHCSAYQQEANQNHEVLNRSSLCFAGDAKVVINISNISAVLHYQFKNNRPSLDPPCKRYLDREVDNLTMHSVIPLLAILDEFGVADQRSTCVEWMATNFHNPRGTLSKQCFPTGQNVSILPQLLYHCRLATCCAALMYHITAQMKTDLTP